MPSSITLRRQSSAESATKNVRSLEGWVLSIAVGTEGQGRVPRMIGMGGRDDSALALLPEDDREARHGRARGADGRCLRLRLVVLLAGTSRDPFMRSVFGVFWDEMQRRRNTGRDKCGTEPVEEIGRKGA